MLYTCSKKGDDMLDAVLIVARSAFTYGFEYERVNMLLHLVESVENCGLCMRWCLAWSSYANAIILSSCYYACALL